MKNTFIKSTVILIIGGFITKILGMIIKIVITRMIKSTGYGLYALILPTMMLLISISQLGLPTALNVLIAKNKDTKKLITASLIISLSIDIIIAIFLLLSSKYISTTLLKEPKVYLGLLGISLILPFISISNILRSYYFAKERMLPHVITNILEDVVKLILIILFLPYFINKGITYAIFFIVCCMLFSYLWVEISGLNAKKISEQLHSSGIQIPGFRSSKRQLYKILKKYIPALTIISGIYVGLIAFLADLTGALGGGTGVLLTVGILHKLYEEMAEEQLMSANPILRKVLGGD